MLKARPEVEQLHKDLAGSGTFDFGVFEVFMKETQKVSWFFNRGLD